MSGATCITVPVSSFWTLSEPIKAHGGRIAFSTFLKRVALWGSRLGRAGLWVARRLVP